jgi:hypothetical protein
VHRRITYLVTLLLALTGMTFISLTAVTGSPAQAKDMDCSDFSSQAAAQHYFDDHGGGPNNNVDLLDADGDGIACESNSCPCTTGGGGGGGGGGTAPPPPPKKKLHNLTAKILRKGPARKLEVTGKVTTFKGGKVQIQRKEAGARFRAYRVATASKKSGAFNRPVAYLGFTKTCFQVVAPETKHYLRTVKFLGCFIKP